MIDIHSHLIFDVDDGSRSLEESINILSMMYEAGVTDMIITPHYIIDSKYMSSKDINEDKLKQIKEELNKRNINMNLSLGNEIFIDNKIFEYLKDNKVSTLNNTKYILVELPMSGIYEGYLDILYSLVHKGYKVILAHPERYISFQKDFNKVYEVLELGVLLQSNYGSILGDYGLGSKRMIKRLMKEKLITYFSSDIHRLRSSNFIARAKSKMKKYYSYEEINDLTNNNMRELIG
jgi:protein-tyrosine phosphatase